MESKKFRSMRCESNNLNPYKVYYTDTGKPFYYNTHTNKSYWIIPKDDRKYFSSGNVQTISTLGTYLRLDKKDKKLFFDLMEQCGVQESATVEDYADKLNDNILYNAYGDLKEIFLNEFIKYKKEKIIREENRNSESAMIHLLKKYLYGDYDASYDYKVAMNFLFHNNFYKDAERRREFYTNFLVNRFVYYYKLKLGRTDEFAVLNEENKTKRRKGNNGHSSCLKKSDDEDKNTDENRTETNDESRANKHEKYSSVSVSIGQCELGENNTNQTKKFEKKHLDHASNNRAKEDMQDEIRAEKDKLIYFESSEQYTRLNTKEILTEQLNISYEDYNRLENFVLSKMDATRGFADIKNDQFVEQFDDIAVLLIYRKLYVSHFNLNNLADSAENTNLMKTYRIKLKNLINKMYVNGSVYYKMEYEPFLKLVKNDLVVRVLMLGGSAVKEEFDDFIRMNWERLGMYENNFTPETKKRLNNIDRRAMETYFNNKDDDELEEGEIKL